MNYSFRLIQNATIQMQDKNEIIVKVSEELEHLFQEGKVSSVYDASYMDEEYQGQLRRKLNYFLYYGSYRMKVIIDYFLFTHLTNSSIIFVEGSGFVSTAVQSSDCQDDACKRLKFSTTGTSASTTGTSSASIKTCEEEIQEGRLCCFLSFFFVVIVDFFIFLTELSSVGNKTFVFFSKV